MTDTEGHQTPATTERGFLDAAKERVSRFDQVVDEAFANHLRGNRLADRIFYTASAVGDHSVLWVLLDVAQAARLGTGWRRAARVVGGLGLESALVNGPVKWAFRRPRPESDEARPLRLRTPKSSSFPSGHATSAFFAAALLRDDPLWPLYYALAAVVATSRVHVRIHHASDVAGGALVGIALGEVGRRLVPKLPLPL